MKLVANAKKREGYNQKFDGVMKKISENLKGR